MAWQTWKALPAMRSPTGSQSRSGLVSPALPGVGETVRLEHGRDPLRLARVMADVPCACAVCGAVAVHRLIASAHWWDREASARLREQARGLSCGRCGTLAELPVPLVQYRDLDGADLVVGLPAGSAADSDRAWIAEIIRCLRDRLPSAPAVVTVRIAWWPFIDAVPLMARQETDEQREVVEYRLSRLARMALEPADDATLAG